MAGANPAILFLIGFSTINLAPYLPGGNPKQAISSNY